MRRCLHPLGIGPDCTGFRTLDQEDLRYSFIHVTTCVLNYEVSKLLVSGFVPFESTCLKSLVLLDDLVLCSET